jgi:hypothetical protein
MSENHAVTEDVLEGYLADTGFIELDKKEVK